MIAVECYPDEAMLRALGVPRARIVHAMGKGNVLNELAAGRVVAGLIDEDPGSTEPPQLSAYAKSEECGSVVLMTRRAKPAARLVVIRPRLEEWLINRADTNSIAPTQYGLPIRCLA